MSGRGRGRGGRGSAGSSTFNREQLNAMGFTPDVVPGPVTQPPPLYPLLERKPIPLSSSIELDYMLILKQDFIDHIQLSGAYLKEAEPKPFQSEQKIDKLIAQLPSAREKFDWALFPAELRPKAMVKYKLERRKAVVDIESRLNELEEMETMKADPLNTSIKSETDKEEEDEQLELVEEEEDEEMDDGTDYANNYFDNGEDYEDEDDNLDDGPIY